MHKFTCTMYKFECILDVGLSSANRVQVSNRVDNLNHGRNNHPAQEQTGSGVCWWTLVRNILIPAAVNKHSSLINCISLSASRFTPPASPFSLTDFPMLIPPMPLPKPVVDQQSERNDSWYGTGIPDAATERRNTIRPCESRFQVVHAFSIMGSKVAASHIGTTSMKTSVPLSTPPSTQCPSDQLPLLYFLFPNLPSSNCV